MTARDRLLAQRERMTRLAGHGCRWKTSYGTRARAESTASFRQAEAGVVLRTYACDTCGGFHLTRVGPDAVR